METNNTAERPHYDSWAECENCNQDRLKKWYDTKTRSRNTEDMSGMVDRVMENYSVCCFLCVMSRDNKRWSLS